MKAKVLRDTQNIRSGPGTDYKILGTLKKNTEVRFTDLGGVDVWVQSAPGKWSAQFYGGTKYLEILPVEKGTQVIKAKVLADTLISGRDLRSHTRLQVRSKKGIRLH